MWTGNDLPQGLLRLRALLETFGPDDDVVLCYRVESSEDAIFTAELERFATEGMTIHIIPGSVIGDDQTDLLGIPALRRGVPDLTTRDCFVCGPPGLIDAVVRRLRKLHVPRKQIHFERRNQLAIRSASYPSGKVKHPSEAVFATCWSLS